MRRGQVGKERAREGARRKRNHVQKKQFTANVTTSGVVSDSGSFSPSGSSRPSGPSIPSGSSSSSLVPVESDAYGTLGRIAPEWWEPQDGSEPDPWLTEDQAFERFLAWVTDLGIELWPHQEDALVDLAAGNHVILGTPTGSGKSMVALGMHFMAMCTGRRSYYTAPIKALVSEKFFNLVDLLGRENVGMATGDVHINTGAPVICCTQEVLANQALAEGAAADIGCVAVDEFHFFGEPDRGWAWQVPLLTLPQTQFLLMSATLGDMTQIAETLKRKSGRAVDVVADAPRPVPLVFEYVKTPIESTVELALRDGKAPIYIVHFSQDAALASAQALASYGVATKEQREAVKAAIKGTRFTTGFGKILKRLLSCGVGVHHAGILPRYRLLVEKLAQQGLLPVICGTDTLGVGINVPIHTVLFTALTKYDGIRQRRLRAREFHQIAGRAGRSGFDTEGLVIVEAPEHEIENEKARLKAASDEKKLRKLKKKRPPEGFVNWSEQTFERLRDAPPEMLVPHMRIMHSAVLALVSQGGDAWARTERLIAESMQSEAQKAALTTRASEVFDTLIEAGVVERRSMQDGAVEYTNTVDLPDDFALDQSLSPFLLVALDLLDPEDPAYALDVISLMEATLEDPRQVLRAQERVARDHAVAEMKAEGIEYEERMERLAEVSYPKPLEDLISFAFEKYCETVPWARDYEPKPKSVLRDMVETASDFKTYVGRYKIAHSEGLLLRYLSDAFRVLDRTVLESRRDERLQDIISWLDFVVHSIDSSLVDEWEGAASKRAENLAAPEAAQAVVYDRRGLTVLVRNALFLRVRLAALGKVEDLGDIDSDFGYPERRWQQVLDDFYAQHEEIVVDGDARSMAYLSIDEADENSDHVWHVVQTFKDSDGDRDFLIRADVDLDATQESGEVVLANYRVGFVEDVTD